MTKEQAFAKNAVKFLIPVFAVRDVLLPASYGKHEALWHRVGLFRFRICGLFTAGAFVLSFAAFEQYKNLLAVIEGFLLISQIIQWRQAVIRSPDVIAPIFFDVHFTSSLLLIP